MNSCKGAVYEPNPGFDPGKPEHYIIDLFSLEGEK
jgi:hypothetical protein